MGPKLGLAATQPSRRASCDGGRQMVRAAVTPFIDEASALRVGPAWAETQRTGAFVRRRAWVPGVA